MALEKGLEDKIGLHDCVAAGSFLQDEKSRVKINSSTSTFLKFFPRCNGIDSRPMRGKLLPVNDMNKSRKDLKFANNAILDQVCYWLTTAIARSSCSSRISDTPRMVRDTGTVG